MLTFIFFSSGNSTKFLLQWNNFNATVDIRRTRKTISGFEMWKFDGTKSHKNWNSTSKYSFLWIKNCCNIQQAEVENDHKIFWKPDNKYSFNESDFFLRVVTSLTSSICTLNFTTMKKWFTNTTLNTTHNYEGNTRFLLAGNDLISSCLRSRTRIIFARWAWITTFACMTKSCCSSTCNIICRNMWMPAYLSVDFWPGILYNLSLTS